MRKVYVWDKFVRLFHWSLALSFTANALLIDEDSDIHEYVGYAVMGLVLARIIWGFVGTQYARFKSFPPSLTQSLEQLSDISLQRRVVHTGHTPLGALMIYNLLGSLMILTLSGFLMTTDMFWGVEWPQEIHEIFVSWTEFSVLLHIAAVIFESRRTHVNLPRAMVSGYKTFDTPNEGVK